MQLKYTWLISDNASIIRAGDVFGSMKVTSTDCPLELKNSETTITLTRGSTINLMDNLYFRVNDIDSLEYYPMKTIPVINQPPVAVFSYSPINPVMNQTITFDASSSYDPDGNIIAYWWNINGNIFTAKIVNISFHDAGTYYAELAVTDNYGSTSLSSRWIDVTGSMPIAPANDDFYNSTIIGSLPFTDALSTVAATTAFDDPYSLCAGNWYGHTVWYSFTPTENSRIEINPAGSDYSPVLLAAYHGSRGALYNIGCNLIFTSPNYTAQPLVVYVYANQTAYFMIGSYGSNSGSNLKLKVDVIPPLKINLNIDPDGSVNRLTGDAMIHGTMTCSRPVSGAISINLSQRAGRLKVIRGSSSFQFWCDMSNSTTWNASIRSSDGPFNTGQVYVKAFASAYEWWTGNFAFDDAKAVVNLRGKER